MIQLLKADRKLVVWKARAISCLKVRVSSGHRAKLSSAKDRKQIPMVFVLPVMEGKIGSQKYFFLSLSLQPSLLYGFSFLLILKLQKLVIIFIINITTLFLL